MKTLTIIMSVLCLLTFSQSGSAADWNRKVELGAVYITGNTEEDSIKLRSDLVGDYTKWRSSINLDYLRSSRDDQLSARKFYGSYKADYKMDNDQFAFGRLSYDDDHFNGFDYQADLLLGYGRTLLTAREDMQLDLEVGPGYRRSEFENGDSEGEAIIGGALRYTWQLSENAQFEQKLSTEIGSDSTISRSQSSISSVIVGDLSMKLQISLKHNSEAPVGTDDLDTESSVTFVYEF